MSAWTALGRTKAGEYVAITRFQFKEMWQHYKEAERQKDKEAQEEMFSKLERQDEKL